MRYLRGFAALCVVAVVGGGCATQFGERIQSVASIASVTSSAASAVSSATVDPKAIIVAANAFDAIEVTAKNYLRLQRCGATSGPVCRSPAATRPLIAAVRSGREARKNALAFLKSHPGQLGPGGLYDALDASIKTVQAIFANYKIGGA